MTAPVSLSLHLGKTNTKPTSSSIGWTFAPAGAYRGARRKNSISVSRSSTVVHRCHRLRWATKRSLSTMSRMMTTKTTTRTTRTAMKAMIRLLGPRAPDARAAGKPPRRPLAPRARYWPERRRRREKEEAVESALEAHQTDPDRLTCNTLYI